MAFRGLLLFRTHQAFYQNDFRNRVLLALDLIRVMALLALAITEFPRERGNTSNCHSCKPARENAVT